MHSALHSALHSARYILEDLNHSEGIKKLSEINGLPEGVIFEAFKNIFSEENEKRVYRYMVNSEIKELSEPLYWYKWNRGGGYTVFGGAYTESEFHAYKTLKESDNPNWPFTNISREKIIEEE
jgi:hypothetical protein